VCVCVYVLYVSVYMSVCMFMYVCLCVWLCLYIWKYACMCTNCSQQTEWLSFCLNL